MPKLASKKVEIIIHRNTKTYISRYIISYQLTVKGRVLRGTIQILDNCFSVCIFLCVHPNLVSTPAPFSFWILGPIYPYSNLEPVIIRSALNPVKKYGRGYGKGKIRSDPFTSRCIPHTCKISTLNTLYSELHKNDKKCSPECAYFQISKFY